MTTMSGTKLRVLVACEYSGRVRDAFLAEGAYAVSCDLLPSDSPKGEHYQGDVLDIIGDGWDLMVAHPPCTDLAVSGARWFPEKRANGSQQRSIAFFMALVGTEIPMKCIENPVSIMSTVWRKPDQIIQPWQFGHGETKATCLWLEGLPLLVPTDIVEGRSDRIHKMPPGPDRWKKRSETYKGIAEAMAKQWSNYARQLNRQ